MGLATIFETRSLTAWGPFLQRWQRTPALNRQSCPKFVHHVEPKLSPSCAQVFPQIGHLRNTLTHCSRALLPALAERSSSAIWASTNLGQHTHEQSSNLPLTLQQIVSQCDPWGFEATNNAEFPVIEIEIALIAFDITIRDLLVCAVTAYCIISGNVLCDMADMFICDQQKL